MLGLLVQMAQAQFSWHACKNTGIFRGKPESIVGRRMGGGGQAGAEKSEVLHVNKWHWPGARISPLHLKLGFSIISSAEWELPTYSNRGGTKEPEVVAGA